jgi:hypothetical protein
MLFLLSQIPKHLLNPVFSYNVSSTPRANVKFLRTNRRQLFARLSPHKPTDHGPNSVLHSPNARFVRERRENVNPKLASKKPQVPPKQPALSQPARSTTAGLSAPRATSARGRFVAGKPALLTTTGQVSRPVPPTGASRPSKALLNPRITALAASTNNPAPVSLASAGENKRFTGMDVEAQPAPEQQSEVAVKKYINGRTNSTIAKIRASLFMNLHKEGAGIALEPQPPVQPSEPAVRKQINGRTNSTIARIRGSLFVNTDLPVTPTNATGQSSARGDSSVIATSSQPGLVDESAEADHMDNSPDALRDLILFQANIKDQKDDQPTYSDTDSDSEFSSGDSDDTLSESANHDGPDIEESISHPQTGERQHHHHHHHHHHNHHHHKHRHKRSRTSSNDSEGANKRESRSDSRAGTEESAVVTANITTDNITTAAIAADDSGGPVPAHAISIETSAQLRSLPVTSNSNVPC